MYMQFWIKSFPSTIREKTLIVSKTTFLFVYFFLANEHLLLATSQWIFTRKLYQITDLRNNTIILINKDAPRWMKLNVDLLFPCTGYVLHWKGFCMSDNCHTWLHIYYKLNDRLSTEKLEVQYVQNKLDTQINELTDHSGPRMFLDVHQLVLLMFLQSPEDCNI